MSMMDTYQAQTLLVRAPCARSRLRAADRADGESSISVLLGQNPGPITRGRGAGWPDHACPHVPRDCRPPCSSGDAGCPPRRGAAGRGANARIRVAKCRWLFPRIFLLGSIGVAGGVQNERVLRPHGLLRDRSYHVGADLQHGPRPGAGVDSSGGPGRGGGDPATSRAVQQACRDVSDSLSRLPQAPGGAPASREKPRPGPAEWDRALERPLRRRA